MTIRAKRVILMESPGTPETPKEKTMSRENVLNLIDELATRSARTLKYLSSVENNDTREFEDDADAFYTWIVHNLRPELYHALHLEEKEVNR